MLDIKKSLSLSAQLQSDDNTPFANFSGSVDDDAVPNMNYYINNQDVYRANTKLFRDSLTEFQNMVFDEADAKQAELDSKTTTTTTTTTVK